jgi:urease accessory protein
MLEASEILSRDTAGITPGATVTLTYDERKRTRLRTRLDGDPALADLAILVPRGTVLQHGDLLRATSGLVIEVRAANEPLSTVRIDDPVGLARACYHLGNRHVPVQIGPGWVRYQRDHVLDHMIEHLGFAVVPESAPFQPEPGAYGGGHSH